MGIKRKIIKSIPGIIALSYIILLFLSALFAYFIVPDSSSHANDQHLEISLKKPGFSCDFLIFKDNLPKNTFIKKLLFGEENKNRSIPLYTYHFTSDSLEIESFTGLNPNEGIIIHYPISELISDAHLKDDLIKSRKFILGTDKFGRDVLSRMILGTRISLSVGFISVFIALLIGISIGAAAGFSGGIIDRFLLWFISVFWSLPTILLAMAVTFALGKGFWQVFVAIGITFWVDIARIVRGQVISIKERDYIEAARALGLSNFRIITQHILPGLRGPLIVVAASSFASAILIEAGLSFLGIGVQAPLASWGMMIKEYYSHLVLDSAYLAIIPGFAIISLVMAFMVLGNEVRDSLDVHNTN